MGGKTLLPAAAAAISWPPAAWWPEILALFAVAFAAALGAAIVFSLERYRANRRERRRHLAAGNRALFALLAQRTLLEKVLGGPLQRLRGDEYRWAKALPAIGTSYQPALDVDSLMFTVDGGDHQLLYDLVVGEMGFARIPRLLQQRALAYEQLDRVVTASNVALAEAGQPPLGVDQLRVAIGQSLVEQLAELTTSLYEAVDQTLEWNRKNADHLRAYLQRTFPRRRIVSEEMPAQAPPDTGRLTVEA